MAEWVGAHLPRLSLSARDHQYAVWLYHRFSLSCRDVEDRLAQRVVTVSYETIRQWCQRFGLDSAGRRRRLPTNGDSS